MDKNFIKCKAYAKINLSLNITGEKNALHMVDMVLTSVSVADEITIAKRYDNNVNIGFSDSSICENNNTVAKTIKLLKSYVGEFGADINIIKNIPLAGGMGGSSADVGGVINALDGLFKFNLSPCTKAEIGLKVGSDVPYMINGGYARVSGVGDTIKNIDSDCKLNMVIVSHDKGISAKDSYDKFDTLYPSKNYTPTDNNILIKKLENNQDDFYSLLDNALLKPSVMIYSEIQNTIDMLEKTDALKVLMTGSGTCVVAFYKSREQALKVCEQFNASGHNCLYATNVKSGTEIIE